MVVLKGSKDISAKDVDSGILLDIKLVLRLILGKSKYFSYNLYYVK